MADPTQKEKFDEMYLLTKKNTETILKWKHIFEDAPELGGDGMFTRMWKNIEAQGEVIKNLPCETVSTRLGNLEAEVARLNGYKQGVQRGETKSKAKTKAKEWGPVGLLVAALITAIEYFTRRGG